ncbi:ubiquinol-cytochrome C chaperone family protein [Tardiphaga sp.]|uniref:ubiquinol-cytochrome C chaperone family protein n=1 Tax=Tardiphaga sp. TaxID=1926292 RepID=UPI00261D1DC3|nr:ubiquinol-cytochrome C chaperone family protein [Tardiphaga sp.]MDB5616956.1 ubiquinol-cytochrome chaperone [Tardiphaga sp.]
MVWPFNHFRKSPAPLRGTIEAIYGTIVAQAREPLFYRDLGVADSVNGRFDMLLLHLWLVMRELKLKSAPPALSQGLVERFCTDMDDNLRELGTSDLRVPKKMQEFGRALYGRAAAYDMALDAGFEPLAQALSKNIYNGSDLDHARRLVSYVNAAIAGLGHLDETTLKSGAWRFPQPAATLVTT